LQDNYGEIIQDSICTAELNWQSYFNDPILIALIDTALKNNQELNIVAQELAIGQSEVLEKSGEYLPIINVGGGVGVEKAGRFTRDGVVEHSLDIEEGREFPEPLGDFQFGVTASWEVDIWKKLRNAKNIAQLQFLAANEGRNFLISNLISEIANTYYELISQDQLLKIVNSNSLIQKDALRKVKIQKNSAKSNLLAVHRFEAQLLNTQNLQFQIQQKIVELENRLNFLIGRYPKSIDRGTVDFMKLDLDSIHLGIPSRLLRNRSDIRQMEYQMQAANLNVRVMRADFYPSLDLSSGIGFQAFNPKYILNPESLIFNMVGDLTAPLVNKRAIKARYKMATSGQIQSVYQYEQTVLRAFTEVLNQLSKLDKYSSSLKLKQNEVQILNKAVKVADNLFKYAKADYVEVLLAQEEALDEKMELVEIKLQVLLAQVDLYKALGGGWR